MNNEHLHLNHSDIILLVECSQEVWQLMPDSHCLDSVSLGKLDAMGSSTLSLFPGVEHLNLEAAMGSAAACKAIAAQPRSLARDSSVPIDSPLSHSLSEVGCQSNPYVEVKRHVQVNIRR